MEQSLSREENRRQGKKQERLPSTIVSEGRKEIQPNSDMDGQTGDATAIKERLVEEHWVRLLSSKNHIWNKEDWMSTSRLENSSLEEQRKKAYGQDQPRIFDKKEEKEIELEMKKIIREKDEMQNAKMHTRKCFQKAGEGGNLVEQAWNFWTGTAATQEAREDTNNTDAEKKQNIQEGRTRTNQVEDKVTVMPAVKPTIDNRIQKEDSFYVTFEDQSLVKANGEMQEGSQVQEKDRTSDKTRKKKTEMRAATEMKDAASRLTRYDILSQERSPGRVMKPRRCTPSKISKISNVRKLKKFFESESLSSPTKGYLELLPQPGKGLNLVNLTTTTGCSRNGPKLCVSQPGGSLWTGPRQAEMEGLQLSRDWHSQPRLGSGGPIGSAVSGTGLEESKK